MTHEYVVTDLQAVEPDLLTKADNIRVEISPDLDDYGFNRVDVYGPTLDDILAYVRENWGDDDADWFADYVIARAERVEVYR